MPTAESRCHHHARDADVGVFGLRRWRGRALRLPRPSGIRVERLQMPELARPPPHLPHPTQPLSRTQRCGRCHPGPAPAVARGQGRTLPPPGALGSPCCYRLGAGLLAWKGAAAAAAAIVVGLFLLLLSWWGWAQSAQARRSKPRRSTARQARRGARIEADVPRSSDGGASALEATSARRPSRGTLLVSARCEPSGLARPSPSRYSAILVFCGLIGLGLQPTISDWRCLAELRGSLGRVVGPVTRLGDATLAK